MCHITIPYLYRSLNILLQPELEVFPSYISLCPSAHITVLPLPVSCSFLRFCAQYFWRANNCHQMRQLTFSEDCRLVGVNFGRAQTRLDWVHSFAGLPRQESELTGAVHRLKSPLTLCTKEGSVTPNYFT